MSLDRPYVLSVCFRLIERLKLVSGTNVDLHMRQTKLINLEKLYDKCLLSIFREKIYWNYFCYDSAVVGSTGPKFDV